MDKLIPCPVCDTHFQSPQAMIVHSAAHNMTSEPWPTDVPWESENDRRAFVDRTRLALSEIIGTPHAAVPREMAKELANVAAIRGPLPQSPLRQLFDKYMTIDDLPFHARRKFRTTMQLMDALTAWAFLEASQFTHDDVHGLHPLPPKVPKKRGRPPGSGKRQLESADAIAHTSA